MRQWACDLIHYAQEVLRLEYEKHRDHWAYQVFQERI